MISWADQKKQTPSKLTPILAEKKPQHLSGAPNYNRGCAPEYLTPNTLPKKRGGAEG
jgi:hypothetical protein